MTPAFRFILIVAVLAIFFAIGGPAHAMVAVAKAGDNKLRLMRTPCTNAGVLEQIKEEWHEKFQAAEVSVNGKNIPGCWILNAEGAVFILFEDGQSISMPTSAFSIEDGV